VLVLVSQPEKCIVSKHLPTKLGASTVLRAHLSNLAAQLFQMEMTFQVAGGVFKVRQASHTSSRGELANC